MSEARGDWHAAIDGYRRGLEVDDLAEELYRRLMVCHLRLGQKGEALSTYERCRRVLGAALGIEPSTETVALQQNVARNV
jgi:DNA-binding SARP family transcriptional activator